jgi:uncharacterized protein (DUF952 family)
VPQAIWDAHDLRQVYEADSLHAEGFIHCTDGEDALIVVGNRYYVDDPRPFAALTIDLDCIGSPWRIDAPGTPYPHVYGPIAAEAVVAVAPVRRAADGQFIGLGTPTPLDRDESAEPQAS